MRFRVAVVTLCVLALAAASASARDGTATRTNGRIVFGLEQADQSQVVSADLRSRRSLAVKGTDGAVTPKPSPDGRFLAYVRGFELHSSVWVSRADGTHRRRLEGGCQPTWAPSSNRLAFLLDIDQRGYCSPRQLAVINGDGSGFSTIYDGQIYDPRWSPDGEWIAFVKNEFGAPPVDDLYVVRPDGSDPHLVAPDIVTYGYSWSPDGRRLVFEKNVAGPGRFEPNLFTAPVAGGALTQLTNDSRLKYDPAWSRDGRCIAFWTAATSGPPQNEVAVLDLQSGGEQLVGEGYMPVWSRDGRLAFLGGFAFGIMVARPGSHARLALRLEMAGNIQDLAWRSSGRGFVFTRTVLDGRSRLFGINEDGTRLHRLKALRTAAVDPAWAPNGRLLAFERARQAGNRELAVSRPDGSHLRMLTRNSYGWDVQPTWSPDGKRVAFVRSSTWGSYYEGRSLHVVRLAGGKARRLTSAKRPDHPAWSPDGQSIAIDGLRNSDAPGIRLVHVQDGATEALTHPSGNAFDRIAVWSPSGGRLAFVRRYPGGSIGHEEVWVLTLATGDMQKIADDRLPDPLHADSLSWAPDGLAIALAGWLGGDFGGPPAVVTIRPDGLGRPIVLWQNTLPLLRSNVRNTTGVSWRGT
jgi:Tol biopolymer transport system component